MISALGRAWLLHLLVNLSETLGQISGETFPKCLRPFAFSFLKRARGGGVTFQSPLSLFEEYSYFKNILKIGLFVTPPY